MLRVRGEVGSGLKFNATFGIVMDKLVKDFQINFIHFLILIFIKKVISVFHLKHIVKH